METLNDYHIAELEQQIASIDGRLVTIAAEWNSPAHNRDHFQDVRQRSAWNIEAAKLKKDRGRIQAKLDALRTSRDELERRKATEKGTDFDTQTTKELRAAKRNIEKRLAGDTDDKERESLIHALHNHSTELDRRTGLRYAAKCETARLAWEREDGLDLFKNQKA